MNKKRVLSLFSECGGMDIGFEGGFKCLKQSINKDLHPNWIENENSNWVTVSKTGFETIFANDIRPDAKAAWVSYFSSIYKKSLHTMSIRKGVIQCQLNLMYIQEH